MEFINTNINFNDIITFFIYDFHSYYFLNNTIKYITYFN